MKVAQGARETAIVTSIHHQTRGFGSRLIVAPLLLVIFAAGCSRGASSPPPQDPAALITKTGAKVVEEATQDVYGETYASGRFVPGYRSGAFEQVTIYTFTSNVDRNTAYARISGVDGNSDRDGDDPIILGRRFMAIVTGVPNIDTGEVDYRREPAAIASALHGKLQPN